jgi:hypothetical protein
MPRKRAQDMGVTIKFVAPDGNDAWFFDVSGACTQA